MARAKDYLITEKPAKALWAFAVPIIMGNLFQQLYTMADSVMAGRFVSEEALAAIGASNSLTAVFIAIAIGGGIGASVLTSNYFGAKAYGKMRQSAYTALISFLAVSILLGAIGFTFQRQIMVLLRTPDNVLSDAMLYLRIYFLGLPFLFLYNVLSSMFNALGKSKIPLAFLIFSSLLNIVLDYVLIRYANLGVAGVAWATLIAQGLSAILAFIFFMRELHQYPVDENLPAFSMATLTRMAKIALPSILQQATVYIGMLLVQSVINSFGSEILAGYSAGFRVHSIFIVPATCIGNALSPYTAQNLGAGQEDRVVKGYHAGAFAINAAFAVGICIVGHLFAPHMISFILGSKASETALATGIGYLNFTTFCYFMAGLKMGTDGLLRGSGDMTMFTVANMVNLTVRVLISVLLAPKYGIAVVWTAVPIGWTCNFIISYSEYRTGKWRHALSKK